MLSGLLLGMGCGDDSPNQPPAPVPTDQAVPDFTLRNLNANSPTFNQDISPRQLQGQISGWYFGSAT
jgi:hypothetical protein